MSHQPCSILITGGCGFIGSNFINFMFQKWPTTSFVNIDKLAPGILETNVVAEVRKSDRYKFIKGTIRDFDLLVKVLNDHQIDTIVHFAAVTHVDESYSDRIGTIKENVLAMTTLLEAVTFRYSGIKRFVHVSTDEVYGDSEEGSEAKTEHSLPNPTNPYAASKAACEMILRAYWHSYKLPFVMVRMNNVYGPYQALSKLIPKFIIIAIEEKPYPLMGDGMHTRSWIYVDDCTDAIRRVCEAGKIGEIYNIGTEFEITNYDVTMMIHRIVNKLLKRNLTPPKFELVSDRPYHDRRYCIDFSKISRQLNWQCTTAFKGGLQKTIQHYLDQYCKKYGDFRLKG